MEVGIITMCLYLSVVVVADSSIEQNAIETDPMSVLTDPTHVKQELKEIIRMHIDADANGLMSQEEIRKWLIELQSKQLDIDVDKQWNLYSPPEHEVFSWEGYLPEKQHVLIWEYYYNATYPELIDRKERGENIDADDAELDESVIQLKKMAKRAETRWNLADENGDTMLTREEFKHLLHPDEGNDELKDLFVREATEDMDSNNDTKISLDEFLEHIKNLGSEQERNDSAWLSSQKENFAQYLDKNNDTLLDHDEVKRWLVPPDDEKFILESARMIEIGDQNDDQHLSAFEVLGRYESFMTLLPPEYWHHKRLYEKPYEDDTTTNKASEKDEL